MSTPGDTLRSDGLEVTVSEVKGAIKGGKLALIDVREPEEFAIARIAGAELVPMNTVPAQLQQLEARADEESLIVICHHGVRSLQVVNWLRQQGVENCYSLRGGIDRWSQEVDPEIPRY